MTPDWLATEDGRKAVEACVTAIVVDGRAIEALTDHATGWAIWVEQMEAKEIDLPTFDNNLFESEKRTAAEFLRAALPHLDRLFRERYAAALEAEANRRNAVDAARFLSPPPDITLAKEYGWRDAVAFLRREPTL